MKTLAWGHFCKHDFHFLHIASKKIQNFEKFAPLLPLLRSNISQVPPSQVNRGNLEMLLLRRGCSAGFRLRRASLLEKLLQVFFPLLFSSRLFFFFPSQFLRGSPASRFSPDPPASSSPLPRPPRPRRSPREDIKLPMRSSRTKYHCNPTL